MSDSKDRPMTVPAHVSRVFLGAILGGFLAFSPETLRADYLDDIGYRALAAELAALGTPLPNGAGVTVTQAEASTGTSTVGGVTSYAYLADQSLFSGVTITNASASAYPATFSGHANTVGAYLYGDTSMASGISSVTAYLADDWIESGGLNFSTASVSHTAPKVESNDVQNHSWVGTTGTAAYDQGILNRLDYSIQRDDYVSVVGVNNGSTAQNLLGSAYNVISVGLTNGGSASGTSSTVNTSVTYPQIVVPLGATSFATPVVSGAAALLIQTARGSAATSANGTKSEVIKAALLAGATKGEFANWSRTDTAPLDATYGAGELNVQNSYDIMTAGEQSPGVVGTTGWDFNSISLGATVSYSMDLTSSADVSVVLTWNAIYTGSNYNALSLSFANINLYLYEVGSGNTLTLVQQSLSAGNIEALWTTDLHAGSYLLKVVYAGNTSGSLSSAEYALAWQSTYRPATPVPEPGWTAGIFVAGLGLLVVVRRMREVKSRRVHRTRPTR